MTMIESKKLFMLGNKLNLCHVLLSIVVPLFVLAAAVELDAELDNTVITSILPIPNTVVCIHYLVLSKCSL